MLSPNNTLHSATRLNLQRLMMVRVVIILSLGLVIVGLMQAKLPLQFWSMLTALAALGVMNALAWLQLNTQQHLHTTTLFLHLLGDIAAFSYLFYFSGGYSNPFIWMYLLPITIAAVALTPFYAWIIASISTGCYTLLMFYYVPLSHLHVHTGGLHQRGNMLDIHLVGMWLGFVVSAIIVAIFINRIGKNLRDYDQQIAQAREKTLEAERLLALGTQAASAAHELGTPLATMNFINNDLIAEYQDNTELVNQLNIQHKQISRCKEILSSMTQSAGMARAESIEQIPLKTFITDALTRWQDTRPAVALSTTLADSAYNPNIILDSTLTRAILNVLDNAADASAERVSFAASWDKKRLVIKVKDFGQGISQATQAKIGTPFFTSKTATGMGLGVYLTQLTLARYEGELTFSNRSEGGLLTTITLPLKQLLV